MKTEAIERGFKLLNLKEEIFHDKLIPVTTAWGVFSLWMVERPPICRVAANVLKSSAGQPTMVVL
jgi:hypothetical protein